MFSNIFRITLIITFFFNFFTKTVFASGEFISNYDVVYNIQEDGNTIVDQKITLTNLLTNLYPKKSDIILGSANIYNITAYDNIGKIYIKVSKENDQTKVSAVFNEAIVGQGKTYIWHLKYETPDLVSLNGLIKEITLPKLDLDPDVGEFNISVNVPISFGPILYTKPINKDILIFNKNELSKNQITIAFGEFQIFNFNLKYYLKNSGFTPVITEIAIPPDTRNQKIFLHTLNPTPQNMEIDSDGNWMAKYQLSPGQKIEVTASGSAQIFLRPLNTDNPVTSFNYFKTWQTEQKFWNITDPKIKKLADTLKTPEKIYDYVVSNLQYDYNRVTQIPERSGSLNALMNPDRSICMEFTDLFIAIARAAGIPARENDGFAYTNNEKLRPLSLKKDILHSWPEYYDYNLKNWQQIDPTWANTTGGTDFFKTFDLNHFTFVKHGKNSEYPYPAGAYKDSGNSKDVEISFGIPQDLSEYENINVNLYSPDSAIEGFKQEAKVEIINYGNTMIRSQNLTMEVTNASLISDPTTEIPPIPPYGKKEISVYFKSDINSKNGEIELSVYYQKLKQSKKITINKLPYISVPLIFVVILVLGIFIYILLVYAKNNNRRKS